MSTGETRILAFLSGTGLSITSFGMMSLPPIGRTIVFLLFLAFIMVIGIVLTFSHVTQRALRQDDEDEHRKAMLWRGGRGPQVVVESPHPQAYQPQPPPFYPQQPAQLSHAQQGMRGEQDVTIGG